MDDRTDDAHEASGSGRLARQAGWLALLFVHLAGPRVRSRVDREDLVQEVFLRVLSAGAHPPETERELRRYLATVARRVVFDVLRALRARKRDAHELPLDRSAWSEAGGLDDALAASATGPLTGLAREEHRDALVAAFERLSPEHRRVLGLRQLEGKSAREAAARLGRSEAAVHSLYRRALEAWERSVREAAP
ncbi:MAG: RNA polymerase sigma factor [Planctomycetota bacterium JB042]